MKLESNKTGVNIVVQETTKNVLCQGKNGFQEAH